MKKLLTQHYMISSMLWILYSINILLLKKISKYKLKFKTKPWITFGIEKSISIKNKLLKRLINKKDPEIKTECHEKYKTYRNLLYTLLKESKQIYYTKYFESNWNNIRNTSKGIKNIISIKNITTTIPNSTDFNNRTNADPTSMSNVFYSWEDKIKYQIFTQTLYRVPIQYKHKCVLLNTNWQKGNIFYNIFIRFPQIIWSK